MKSFIETGKDHNDLVCALQGREKLTVRSNLGSVVCFQLQYSHATRAPRMSNGSDLC